VTRHLSLFAVFVCWLFFVVCFSLDRVHGRDLGRMARGGHELPKVSTGLAIPYPSTFCEQATPEMALWTFQGWPACRAGGLRPSLTPLVTPHLTPMVVMKVSKRNLGRQKLSMSV
jgi:hypothetical protein